jgi:DNA helicase-2/ATP-dependent DNA helicase PcrA
MRRDAAPKSSQGHRDQVVQNLISLNHPLNASQNPATRARKRLYLSHSQTRMLHGQTRYNLRSRFFDELPENALKWLSSKPKFSDFTNNSGYIKGNYYSNNIADGAIIKRTNGQNNFNDSLGIKNSVTQTPQAGHEWLAAGKKVFHNKFGEGTVLTVEGAGADARAQINFPRHGVKWLALSVAKLTALP